MSSAGSSARSPLSTRSFDMGCTRDANAKLADRGDRARARFKARGERAGNLKLKLGQGWASGFLFAILRRIPVLFSRLLTASSESEVPGFQLTHLTPSPLSSKLFGSGVEAEGLNLLTRARRASKATRISFPALFVHRTDAAGETSVGDCFGSFGTGCCPQLVFGPCTGRSSNLQELRGMARLHRKCAQPRFRNGRASVW